MRYLSIFLAGLLISGCASTPTPNGEPAATVHRATEVEQLDFIVAVDGRISLGNMTLTDADIPDLVSRLHPTSAIVVAAQGAQYSALAKVADDLKAAGVKDVAISPGSQP
jgi:biopolymer transport protein ExbD